MENLFGGSERRAFIFKTLNNLKIKVMKKVLVLSSLVVGLLLQSCSNEQDKKNLIVSNYVKSQLYSPDSYRLDSIKVVDTIYQSDSIVKKIITNMNLNQTYYDSWKSYKAVMDIVGGNVDIKDLKQALKYADTCEQYVHKLKSMESDNIIGLVYQVNFTGQNKLGVMLKGVWYVSTDFNDKPVWSSESIETYSEVSNIRKDILNGDRWGDVK
jgi:hypothetical protein